MDICADACILQTLHLQRHRQQQHEQEGVGQMVQLQSTAGESVSQVGTACRTGRQQSGRGQRLSIDAAAAVAVIRASPRGVATESLQMQGAMHCPW